MMAKYMMASPKRRAVLDLLDLLGDPKSSSGNHSMVFSCFSICSETSFATESPIRMPIASAISRTSDMPLSAADSPSALAAAFSHRRAVGGGGGGGAKGASFGFVPDVA